MIINKIKPIFSGIVLGLLVASLPISGLAKNSGKKGNTAIFKSWVVQMKAAPRGPFHGIRWFCKDGVILLPRDYSCGVHGGGVQHGQRTSKAKQIRASGYRIANVFADFTNEKKAKRFFRSKKWRENIGQVLTERFLIGFDDGWVFRKARFYRGALQVEDEAAGAKELLGVLFQKAAPGTRKNNQDFLLIREAYRLMPRQRKSATINSVRNLTTKIAARDAKFLPIRTKIHNLPDKADARRVRDYASKYGKTSLKKDYAKLTRLIQKVYAPANIASEINRFARTLGAGDLKTDLQKRAKIFTAAANDETRLLQSALLLRELRESYPRFRTRFTRYKTLVLSHKLEQEAFTAANKLAKKASRANRSQNLKWLKALGEVIYGSGLISQREWVAFNRSMANLSKPNVPLGQYRKELHYLNRVPGWANHWLQFHFAAAINKFSRIEPLAKHFIPDRLRSSPLLAYGLILDALSKDANKLSGVRHQLFGETIGAGLRPLNPGMARGILRFSGQGSQSFNKNSIVLLPETTAELAPVAGILTMGEGNALSHVQLLAGNLGIPNVVISDKLQSLLKPKKDSMVVLAVSPGGIVQLEADSEKWHEYFSRQITPQAVAETGEDAMIKPDMEKLDLDERSLISLADLRATQAGRITGPKAANLGELKHFFPQAVTSGLVIPFGVFREFLDQPFDKNTDNNSADGKLTVFEWMQAEYARIRQLDSAQRAEATSKLQDKLRHWILSANPGKKFRKQLVKRLKQTFGKDGSYAVFVRSDTNVEDLPGFTGAGLNLTVPNVKGYKNILKAIQQVWASPFSKRAFAWRQQRMANPEHVYPSVLLLKSVPVDKSGVMLTLDTITGKQDALTIAVNNGIGGAVQGQVAEELSIDPQSGTIRLLADATAAKQRVLSRKGGLLKKQLPADGRVLSGADIKELINLSKELEAKFPQRGETGEKTAADIEFGFKKGKLVLFQVRPFLQNRRVKKNHYLNTLDQALNDSMDISVNMDEVPSS